MLARVLALAAAAAASAPAQVAAPARPLAQAEWLAPGSWVPDGDPGEWTAGRAPGVVLGRAEQLVALGSEPPASAWSGQDDLCVELWLGWTLEDLVVGGRVRDDVARHDAETWWRGDSLELFLNAVDREPTWGPDDFQVMLAPNWPERPWGVYAREEPGGAAASDGGFGGVEVAGLDVPGGYTFEARLPWSNFGIAAPAGGARFAFNFAACDLDLRGELDSYSTWSGEPQVAMHADRRGELELAGSATALPAGALRGRAPAARVFVPIALALLYGLALWTRRIWRRPRAVRLGAALAALAVLAAFGIVEVVRWRQASERAAVRAGLERYAADFGELVSSGALGRPEPNELLRRARALLDGRGLETFETAEFRPFALAGHALGALERTWSRGFPFQRFREGAEAGGAEGFALAPGQRATFALGEALVADALHLVLRVRDPAWSRVTDRPIPILRVQALAGGAPAGPPITLRHRRHLQLDEEGFRAQPGLEPAFFEEGGRLGRRHAVALLLELEARTEVDSLEIENLAAASIYTVEVVAASARVPHVEPVLRERLRASPDGLAWSGWRADVAAAVRSLASIEREVPGAPAADAAAGGPAPVQASVALGHEPLLALELRSRDDASAGPSRWEVLPLATAAVLAPFLVALAAELLAQSRRIRWKLAVGFVISSAVPLLALTYLLDATLRQERAQHERERLADVVERGEHEIEVELAELETRAGLLLDLAEWRAGEARRFPATSDADLLPEPAFPASSDELDAWWGVRPVGEWRLLERVAEDGALQRVGSGPGWRALPRPGEPRTGLARLFGRLYCVGVAHSQGGAEVPLCAVVLRSPRLADALPAGLEFRGAGRGRAPTSADLATPAPAEAGVAHVEGVRRGLFDPEGALVGVLVAEPRDRGVPILGDWSLIELLLAAGMTALFTATLFAVILTGHIVRPIERLDRALRDGLREDVPVAVRDEVGHLTNAIQAFAGELAERVDQLEALQVAQEQMSGRLDADRARRAVLAFFERRTGARARMLWAGDSVLEPSLWSAAPAPPAEGEGAAARADVTASRVVPGRGWLGLALVAGEVLHWCDGPGLGGLSPRERALLGEPRRLLSLPLVAGGECRGAIVLAYDTPAEPADLDFLRAVASQAAVVLENAQLYEQAVNDPVTGFLTEPSFLQRVREEIQRARGFPGAGVLILQVRVPGLPADDERASERLREAARRLRSAVWGLALFGRWGSSDLRVAVPWTAKRPDFEAVAARVADGLGAWAWPDGEPVGELGVAWAAWPTDGPSARFVISVLEERRAAVTPRAVDRPRVHEHVLPDDLVAESPLYLELLESLKRIASQEVTVLLTGETGTGKDRLAELCHRWSPRAAGPLVHVHCPSLTDDLIEDELFGHEVGAFTGADAPRPSPFEFAAGGTVVLDEVGGLSPAGQVALLRVLENREVLPLGSSRARPIDVRIVATTSLDLAAEVEAGRFRRDLYFRLNAAHLTVPPLRLRRKALPELVARALRRFNSSADRPVTGVAPPVLDAFFEHAWPGNLRELENVIARGLALAEGGELQLGHLAFAPLGGAQATFVSSRQAQALRELAAGGLITSAEYADLARVSARTALRDLQDLVDLGLLEREGAKRGTRFRRTPRATS